MAGTETTFEVDQTALDSLRANLAGISNGVERATIWACNRTAEHLRTVISTRIRSRIAIKKRDIDPFIKLKRASSRGGQTIQSTVTLSKSKRIPLKYFGVKQVGVVLAQKTADRSRAFGGRRVGGGVVYPIGKHFAEHGFMGPRPGKLATKLFGQAWIRPNDGPRKPIKVLKGPSPWGVFVLSGAMPDTLINAKAEMDKNIAQAVNYLLLQKAGGL